MRVGEQTYPLGQATVDVLNFPAEDFSRLCDLTEAFGRAYDRLLDQRDKRMAENVQAKFNAALDAITTLPPYRDLKLDAGSRTFLLDLREMPEEWDESMRPGSEANRMFGEPHFFPYTDFYRALAHGNAPLPQLRALLFTDARVQHLLLQQHRAGRDDAHLPQGRRAREGEAGA